MNYDFENELEFKKAVEFARSVTKRETPKASKILDIIIDKPKRDYLNFCYAYLRWADDIVDEPGKPVYLKKIFIEHQKNLIYSLYTNPNIKSSEIAEACIIYFARYAIFSNKIILLDEVKNMVEALCMDVSRLKSNGVFSKEELDHYIELMSKSLFNILCNFSIPESRTFEEFYLGAKFTTICLMMRDLDEDIDNGYINISTEDIKHYNLDIKNIKEDKNFSLWLSYKIKSVFEMLREETLHLKNLPIKFRILTYYAMIYRLPWIIRARVYGYSLKYVSEKTLYKELRTYLASLLISINIFVRGFIFSSNTDIKNKKSSDKISLQEALKTARVYTRKRSPKFWIITQLLISRKKRQYIFLSFNYLKWADDFVDDPRNNKYKKIEFIEEQINLISKLLVDKKVEMRSNEEFFLYYYINYAKTISNYNLIYEVKKNIEAIGMDAKRILSGGLFNREDLNKYADATVRPIFNLTYYFLLSPSDIKEPHKYTGRFVWKVLILRDFFEDIESGYINISREEIEKYKIDIKNLKGDTNRIHWMREKYPEILQTLNEDIEIFKSIPLKVKLFWSPIYPFMIAELFRIKMYDYNFGIKIQKNFNKELQVYLKAALLSIKFYLKIFL